MVAVSEHVRKACVWLGGAWHGITSSICQWQHDLRFMFHDLNHNKVAGNGKCLVSMLNLAIP